MLTPSFTESGQRGLSRHPINWGSAVCILLLRKAGCCTQLPVLSESFQSVTVSFPYISYPGLRSARAVPNLGLLGSSAVTPARLYTGRPWRGVNELCTSLGAMKDECELSVLGSASTVTVVTLEAVAGMPHHVSSGCEGKRSSCPLVDRQIAGPHPEDGSGGPACGL